MKRARRIVASWLRPSAPRLGVAFALCAMAAAIYLMLTMEQVRVIDVATSYDNYWVGQQLLNEYQQLETDLVRAEHGDPEVPLDVVQLRVDVLFSRKRTALEGTLAYAFRDVAAYQAAMAALETGLAEADQVMAGATTMPLPEVARQVRAAISSAGEPIRDLRLEIRQFYAETSGEVQRRMNGYLSMIAALFAVGAGGLVVFVILYGKQNARLRRSEETFRNTFDRAGVGIGHLSPDGHWLRVNATLGRLLGREAPTLRGESIRALLPDVADFGTFIAPLVTGRAPVLSLDHAYRGAGESQAQAVLTLSVVDKPAGGIDYVILIMEDVTERRSIEAQLQQAQKMEAVGQLTGGVAHDFNNLLGVIVGNLDMLDAMLDRNPEAKHHLDRALAAAERGASLTGRLLAFSRRQTLMPQPTDVNRLIGDIGALLRPTLGKEIQIKTHLRPALQQALVDPGQLEAALVNLAINSRDAMEAGGTLTIGADAFDPDDAPDNWELRHGDYVVVSVSDTGAGMSPDVLARVFEPFFTTKGIGKGTGLGLSMVYGFAKQSGGHVQIESAVGRGTTVRLYLPAAIALQAEVA